MKKVVAADLKAGMIVADAIYSLDHRKILVPSGTVLTDKLIDKIIAWDVPFVQVKLAPGEEPEEKHSPADTDAALGFLPEEMVNKVKNFTNYLEAAVFQCNRLFEEIRANSKVELESFYLIAAEIEPHLVQPSEVIGRILFKMPLPTEKNYLAYHSVAVASVAGMVARWMELPLAVENKLFLAGLLHDVGCTQMPRGFVIENDPIGKRVEVMKEHAINGLKLLKSISKIDPVILAVVAQHHENYDGSGYPMGLAGDKINPLARIVAFADQLCRMAENPAGLNPFAIAEDIKAQMFTKLEAAVCDTFVRRFSDYILNYQLKLNDGRKAKVVFLPTINPSVPILKTEDGEIVDLSKKSHVKIDRLII